MNRLEQVKVIYDILKARGVDRDICLSVANEISKALTKGVIK